MAAIVVINVVAGTNSGCMLSSKVVHTAECH